MDVKQRFLKHACSSAIGMAVAAGLASPARALVITPTYDATIGANATIVAAITTAISAVESLYGDSGTVGIYFAFDSAVFGQSNNGVTTRTFAQYKGALQADATANPANTVLANALPFVGTGNTASSVRGTTAYLRVALGFNTTPCFSASGVFSGSCGAVNDAVISLGNLSYTAGAAGFNSEGVGVIEHELNEVLGGGGAGTALSGSQTITSIIGPIDFYRYHASGANCGSVTTTASNTSSGSEVACYSLNGGVTSLVQMNQTAGADFGDFVTPGFPKNIQDAFSSGPNTLVYSTASAEYVMMQSIGWDPVMSNAVAEPASIALFAGGIAGLGFLRRRRETARGQPIV